MRISILGVDYRSAICAGCLSYRGHRVIGVDSLQSRADLLNQGADRSLEAGLELLLKHGWEAGLLAGTTDLPAALRDTDITFVDGSRTCVDDTPVQALEEVCRRLGEALKKKPDEHRLLVHSHDRPERILARLAPILESSSGRRLGKSLHLEVSQDYLCERSARLHGQKAGRPDA